MVSKDYARVIKFRITIIIITINGEQRRSKSPDMDGCMMGCRSNVHQMMAVWNCITQVCLDICCKTLVALGVIN